MNVDASNPSSSTGGSRSPPRNSAVPEPQKNSHGLLPFFVDGNPIKNGGRKTLRSAFSGAFFKVICTATALVFCRRASSLVSCEHLWSC